MSETESTSEVYELYRRGVALLESGDFQAAIVSLSRARRLEPDKASIREALGRALFRSQRYHEAVEEFGAVAAAAPTDDYAHFCLGRALQLLGRHARRAGRSRSPPACDPTAASTAPTAIARARRPARTLRRHPGCPLGTRRRIRRGPGGSSWAVAAVVLGSAGVAVAAIGLGRDGAGAASAC
jgi:tetratricopeptide (TPR) repeat protein